MGKIQKWPTSVKKRENAYKALTLAVHNKKTMCSERKMLSVKDKKYNCGNPVPFYMLG
jgi:hypothetical protein